MLFYAPSLPILLFLILARAPSASDLMIYSGKSSKSPTACSNGTGSFPVFGMLSGSPVSLFVLLWVAVFRLIHATFSAMWGYANGKQQKSSLIMRKAVVMRPGFCRWSAADSPTAGFQCVYTLSVVTVVGLGLVCRGLGEDKLWGRLFGKERSMATTLTSTYSICQPHTSISNTSSQ